MHHAIVILCLMWSFAPSFAYGRPPEVIVIRHGEKPEQGDDLSVKGRERAAAIVPFFKDGGDETPAAIYAQGPSDSRHSRRPVETVTPLANELNLTVKTYHHSDYAEMAKEILAKPEYDGKVVLICWEHNGIPDVAAALGVIDPPDWRGHSFDRLWIIRFKDGKAKLQEAPQRLLFGDSAE
jgi:broad specificity phosphatase PhoE